MTARVWVAVAIVLVPLLGYPLVTLAGGSPRFPSRQECVRSPVEGQPVDVVFGRFDDPELAAETRDRVVAVGFIGTEALRTDAGVGRLCSRASRVSRPRARFRRRPQRSI